MRVDGEVTLSEVFNGVAIKTEEGNVFHVCQRGMGLEITSPSGLMTPIGIDGVEAPSASEALFAFMGWLTTRDPIAGPFSARHNAGQAAELVKEYCDLQGWSEPRVLWIHLIKSVSAEVTSG